MEKARKYTVRRARNGFIIEFDHEEKSYNDENKRIAMTIEDVGKILDDDLRMPPLPIIEA